MKKMYERQREKTPWWVNLGILIVIGLMVLALWPMVEESLGKLLELQPVDSFSSEIVVTRVQVVAPAASPVFAVQPIVVTATPALREAELVLSTVEVVVVPSAPEAAPTVDLVPAELVIVGDETEMVTAVEVTYDPEFLLACWTARDQGRRVSPRCPANAAELAELMGGGR